MKALVGAGVAAALFAGVLIGTYAGRDQGTGATRATTTTTTTTVWIATTAPLPTRATTTAPATTTSAPATTTTRPTTAPTTAPTTTAAPVPVTTAAPPAGPIDAVPAPGETVRWAVYDGGRLYLRGRVPDQATADRIASRAGAVVGPQNVIVEYVVDPAAPLPASAPVYVTETVLFATDRAEILAPFRQILDLGVALLTNVPTASVTVVGHTDDRGSDEYNLELSQRRVDAVVAYLVERGVPPERVQGVALGKSDPIAPNDSAAGRAANRRVAFVLTGVAEP